MIGWYKSLTRTQPVFTSFEGWKFYFTQPTTKRKKERKKEKGCYVS